MTGPAGESGSSEPTALRALAARLGIASGFRSAIDGRLVETSDATRERLITAMGHAAGNEAEARIALEALEAADAASPLPAACVATAAELQQSGIALSDTLRHAGDSRCRATLRDEAGRETAWESELEGGVAKALRLPAPLGWGVYDLSLEISKWRGDRPLRQRLIVVPEKAWAVAAGLGGARGFGLVTQLYTLRRPQGWGAGDLGELRDLIELAGREGAAFIGLNPIHALANQGHRIVPYSPLSRLFRNPVYLEIERIPEWQGDERAHRIAEDPRARAAREQLVGGDHIDLAGVAALKRPVLERLYASFLEMEAGAPSDRGRAFQAFREEWGESLRGFAIYMTLAEHLQQAETESCDAWDWRTWPSALRDSQAPEVRRFARDHALAIDFHAWCQFELDRQLAASARNAREAGLCLGLFTDLALGSAAGGCDEWLFRDHFAGASAGAPPDAFAPEGQDWSFPPLDPWRLRGDGFRFWTRLLRASFAHAGGLRLDHALALRRLYWIPSGAKPSEGAYVAYPEREMLGILALESHRAQAAVVAEDLGTVPAGFSESLREHGLLTSSVLLFERDYEREGAPFLAADRYPARSLASASTHDLPPLAAWLGEADLELRRRLGQIASEADLDAAHTERRALRSALATRLKSELPDQAGLDPEKTGIESLADAVTRFLCKTEAELVALSVDDLAGETELLNLPGVPAERYESWRRPVSTPPSELARHPVGAACLAAVPRERRTRPQAPSESSTRGSSTDPTTSRQA